MQDKLTKSVMQAVAKAEKKRSLGWLGKVGGMVGILVIGASVLLVISVWQLQVQGTLDLLNIFGEDPEIIHKYGVDTIVTFWQELPQGDLIAAVGAVIVGVIVVIWARKGIKVSLKRLQQVGK